jgi:uncharacterized membrane protein
MLTIVIIAIVVFLVVALIGAVTNLRSAADRPMTTQQYDYYHYMRNHR